jgi:large subunit ribosomal protein L17
MRMAGRVIRSSEALEKLFKEVAPRFKGRTGGYVRVLKTRVRPGDATPLSFVELVEGAAAATPAPTPEPDEGKKKKAKKANPEPGDAAAQTEASAEKKQKAKSKK